MIDQPLSLKALIVEQDLANRQQLGSLLRAQGYQTIEAGDGQQAVELFQQQSPCIIFMGIHLPIMDGHQATRRIKLLAGESFIPVIFLASDSDSDQLQACIDAGGDDFLLKPYDRFQLQSKVHSMQRITLLNRKVKGMYSLIHREQEIAEQVFNNAVQKNNIQSDFIKSIIRPASTFSGDMILSEISPSRNIHFLLGDFTGHGLSAALGALPVSEVFRAMTSKGFSPEEILRGINKKLRQFLPVGMFLCVQFIVISHDLKKVTVFNAGMPALLIVDALSNRIKQRVSSNCLPLGIIDELDSKHVAQSYALNEGDKLILYSDGLIEAESETAELFSSARLENTIQQAPSSQLFEYILLELERFCSAQTYADDVSLIQISCMPGLMPMTATVDSDSARTHSFDSKGDWEYVLNLKNSRLRETNPVPIIINQLMEMEGIESERQPLFTVLTELYVNALDHGVLSLESSMKSDSDGFARYFQQREERLSTLTQGHIVFHLAINHFEDFRSIKIRIEDSGEGFDYLNPAIRDTPDPARFSGRGILIINQLCDSLTHYSKGNITEAIYSWKSS